jgi:hypothetical protein
LGSWVAGLKLLDKLVVPACSYLMAQGRNVAQILKCGRVCLCEGTADEPGTG